MAAAPTTSVAQRIARYALIAALVLLGGWMLRRFIPALCWAIVLAIATSSLYGRWLARFNGKRRDVWAALSFTTLLAVVLIVPIAYGAIVAVREAIALAHSLAASGTSGLPELPQWLTQLPVVGDWIQNEWRDALSNADATTRTVTQGKPAVFEWTRAVGVQVLRRVTTLVFTLLTLYFVYLNRDQLRSDVPRVSRLLFGHAVEGLLSRAVEAVRAAVDGIVLVAVAQGAIMSGVYALAGAPHPVLFGAITGIFAMIPFAAPVVFLGVAVLLFTKGAVGAAIGVAVTGAVMLFVADHFVRPVIIGGGARLPFLWVLLGILGGIESFGVVGLFVGPALMAALVSIWRSWVAEIRAKKEVGDEA